MLLSQYLFGTVAGEIGNRDDVVPLVLRLCLRHHRHARQVCGGDHGWIDAVQPPSVKGRPFARVRQQGPQPLGLVVVDLFPRPVEAPDVILQGALYGIHVRGA